MFVAFDSLKDTFGPFLCFLQLIMQKVPPPFLTILFVCVCLCATSATSYIIVTALFVFCVFNGMINRRVFQACWGILVRLLRMPRSGVRVSFGIGWLWIKWRVQHWRILVTVQ